MILDGRKFVENNLDISQMYLKFGGDCSIVLLFFQTRIVDLSQVDAILLSNSSCMLALPYITEYTGFKGSIYCTDPTLQIGR